MADENGIRHSHDVIDDDPHFKIDAATREITRTSEAEPVLIQYDHNSERFTFEIPRLIDGHDMTLCNKIEVNFINTEATNIKNTYGSKYVVDDLAPVDGDDDTLVFTWLISGAATGLVGPLAFAISFACTVDTTDENGEVVTETTYRWNTKPYVGVVITDGLETQELMNENYYDYVDEWSNTIEQTGVTSVGAVEHAESVAVGNIAATVVNAETASIKKIDDHVAEVVEETRKELTASALDAKDILVQTTGQATDKVMSQKATTDALDANFNNLSAADSVLENTLRSEIAILNRNVVDLLNNDELKRYVLLHRGEPTVDGDETVPPEPYIATEGIKYAVHSEASNADDGYGYFFRASAVVEYCPYSSYGDPTSTPIRRKSIAIESELCVVSNQYLPSGEPTTWTRQEDDTLYIKLPEYDKYGNGVLTMRFLDCYITYVKDDGGLMPGAGIQLNVVYELDGERKTLVVPVCESSGFYLEYTYTPTGAVISSLPKLIECKYEIDTTRAAAYEVYRINEFLDGDTVSYTVNANNIASVKRTKTEGLVDTYTVMFDDGKSTTFNVTNGRAIVSIEKTGTINDEDIYTVYFNDGTTMTFTVPNVEANRSYIEDNVEDLRMILDEFGATTTEQATGLAGVIDVPARVSKYARLNSFGGMSRKVAVPTVQGHNLLPFPYANGNLGTDGAGTFEFTGLIADVSGAVFIDSSNPLEVSGGLYKFVTNATNGSPYLQLTYIHDGETVSVIELVKEYTVELSQGDVITYFSYSDDLGADTSAWSCKPAIYKHDGATNDEGGLRGWENYMDSEWVPRVAQYKFEHTKLQAIKSVGANLLAFPYVNESGTVAAGVTYTVNSDGGVRCSGTATASSYFCLSGGYNFQAPIPNWLVPGKQYTISGGTSTKDILVQLYLYYADGSVTVVADQTFTMPEGAEYYGIFILTRSGNTVDTTIYPMLNSGDTALEYTPYVEHIYTIPKDIPTPDGFETADGTRYQDFVDVKNQKYIPKVYTKVFTGDEGYYDSDGNLHYDNDKNGTGWRHNTGYSPTNVFSYYAQFSGKDGNAVAMRTGVCNEYPTTKKPSEFGVVNGIYMETSSSYIITDMECATLPEFLTKLRRRYAEGNPVTVKCVLWKEIEDASDFPTRLDKLIPIEPNGHLIAVTNTGEEVPLDVEITVIGPNINEILDGINQALETLLNGGA